jgi:hypothetical protein
MAQKTQKQLIEEIHKSVIQLETVILGIPDTDERGIVGDIKEIKEHQIKSNGKYRNLEIKFWTLVGILAGAGVLEGLGIINLFG